MSEETGYNGWTNYETWNVALWLGNDQGLYEWSRELAATIDREAEPTQYWTREESARFELADHLKDWTEDQNPLAEDASMWSDLLRAAFSEVNWTEIAQSLLSEIEHASA